MKDDIRYSEFLFLQAVANRSFEYFNPMEPNQRAAFGLDIGMYIEMAQALLEDLSIRFENDLDQLIVYRLRGELAPGHLPPGHIHDFQWANPRSALGNIFNGGHLRKFWITYRGLRRIEELRDILKRDRILDHFGVLLDLRYFHRDLEDALQRSAEIPVSVIRADMDNFKRINEQFGHPGGDVVMKAYLEAVKHAVGRFGSAYRGVGDEVTVLLIGMGQEKSVSIAEDIRTRVSTMQCVYQDKALPSVTSSLGVASAPPEKHSMEIEAIADSRQIAAKRQGKNRVVGF